MDFFSKALILCGTIMVIGGLIMMYAPAIGSFQFGSLPGDIFIERENSRIYIPITSGLLTGVFISAITWFFFGSK